MGYLNPLMRLPAMADLMEQPTIMRKGFAAVLRQLRTQANDEAEKSWRKKKGPMAAYWRAVATYCRHTAHALDQGQTKKPTVVIEIWRGMATVKSQPDGVEVVIVAVDRQPDDPYSLAALGHSQGRPCTCGSCEWSGSEDEVITFDGGAGGEQAIGRCPDCKESAFLVGVASWGATLYGPKVTQ